MKSEVAVQGEFVHTNCVTKLLTSVSKTKKVYVGTDYQVS